MEIYPAIDLMNGKAVRLVRGESSSAKIYGDPVDFAVKFSEYFKAYCYTGKFFRRPLEKYSISR